MALANVSAGRHFTKPVRLLLIFTVLINPIIVKEIIDDNTIVIKDGRHPLQVIIFS